MLHPGAVVVVALVRPGVVLLLRQYRHAVGAELVELPAGTLEPNEAPETCAARELAEETGRRAGTLKHLTTFWSSPGILREKMHLFLAQDLTDAAQSLDEDEVIEVVEVALSDAVEMVRDGRIADAKTIVGLLYCAQFETKSP